MKKKFKLLTWNIEDDCIFSKEFRYECEAIQTAQAFSSRKICPHDIIGILREKITGHKWELAVWNIDKPQKVEYISFPSKKDAIFAIKTIKEYNDTLKVELTKIY